MYVEMWAFKSGGKTLRTFSRVKISIKKLNNNILNFTIH